MNETIIVINQIDSSYEKHHVSSRMKKSNSQTYL